MFSPGGMEDAEDPRVEADLLVAKRKRRRKAQPSAAPDVGGADVDVGFDSDQELIGQPETEPASAPPLDNLETLRDMCEQIPPIDGRGRNPCHSKDGAAAPEADDLSEDDQPEPAPQQLRGPWGRRQEDQEEFRRVQLVGANRRFAGAM